jgi:hypothetical protein
VSTFTPTYDDRLLDLFGGSRDSFMAALFRSDERGDARPQHTMAWIAGCPSAEGMRASDVPPLSLPV